MSLSVSKKDEIIMRLVHYFVTEENYQPIIVNGVKNEIWLENIEAPYRIIRINSNYIHNEAQLNFDKFKVKNIAKQIKKKTLSFKVNTLNILLDLNEDVDVSSEKGLDIFKIENLKDVRDDEGLAKTFPKLKTLALKKGDNLDLIVNITNDINEKTEKDNTKYEKIFSPKKIVVTNVLMGINILMFVITMLYPNILDFLILNPEALKAGQYWRVLTGAFLHADVLHIFLNMYSLKIVGSQVENFFGKTKFLFIYLGSAIMASLVSCIMTNGLSLGASGAVFGLLGCLAYFGYHYRLYLSGVLKNQLIPIILFNLVIGFLNPYIDNGAHIGGLVGGIFLTMIAGVGKKDDKISRINGIIITAILTGFLLYLIFIR